MYVKRLHMFNKFSFKCKLLQFLFIKEKSKLKNRARHDHYSARINTATAYSFLMNLLKWIRLCHCIIHINITIFLKTD